MQCGTYLDMHKNAKMAVDITVVVTNTLRHIRSVVELLSLDSRKRRKVGKTISLCKTLNLI